MKKKINVGENLFEETVHGDYSFPFQIDHERLSAYEHGCFEVHWHPEPELTVILDGAMEYQANDSVYRLTKGCGIFVNANGLHTARSYEGTDCNYIAVTFNPVLVFGHENSAIQKNYVDPIIESPAFSSFFLDPACGRQNRMLQLLLEINTIYLNRGSCYELQIKSRLCELWSALFEEFQLAVPDKSIPGYKDISYLKQILNYIHSNYKEKLTLEGIASAGDISKSKCCHFFKKTMRQTPFEYLLKYRIQKSIPFLLDGTFNITEISDKVGFSNASYFSETFRKYMKTSPTEFRKSLLSQRE